MSRSTSRREPGTAPSPPTSHCWSGRLRALLVIGTWLLAPARFADVPTAPALPFLLGGIQVHEKDHERWAGALHRAGMNTVQVTAYATQGRWDSADLWWNQDETAVVREIRAARRNGLAVVLVLRVSLDHDDPANRFLWHGLISPVSDSDLEEWFDRYGTFVRHWARIAQAEDVTVLGIASEMNALVATRTVEEIPALPAFYLDEEKQLRLRDLVVRSAGELGDEDRAAFGAGDHPSLEAFLQDRSAAERQWASTVTYASEPDPGERLRRINLRREQQGRKWRRVIAEARAEFRGTMTLAANFDNVLDVGFWDALDLIGINAYYPLRPSLESESSSRALEASWTRILEDLAAFRADRDLDHGILLTELGYTRKEGVTVAPWSSGGYVALWERPEGELLVWSRQGDDPAERVRAVDALRAAVAAREFPLSGLLYWKLSSEADLARYEPFMLSIDPDSDDPLVDALGRFAPSVQPIWSPAVTSPGPSTTREGRTRRDRYGMLPLHRACFEEIEGDLTEILPPRGTDLRDERGETPAFKCVRTGNAQVLRQLLEHRPNLVEETDPSGRTPLHLAADQAPLEIVLALLHRKASTKARDQDGLTPLHVAARRGQAEIVRLLLDTRGVRDEAGFLPIDHAANRGREDVFDILWESLPPTLRDDPGRLGLAAHGGSDHILRRLLDRGLDIDFADTSGRVALHHAAEKGHREATRLLVEKGASVDAEDAEGRTPLHIAAAGRDARLVDLLLQGGSDPSARDQTGATPLHHAASWGRFTNTRLLLEAGAPARAGDRQGRTARDLALQSGRQRVLALLPPN